ncbi:hypothetical protein AN1V17_03630 [Vallitalea sediminicola]
MSSITKRVEDIDEKIIELKTMSTKLSCFDKKNLAVCSTNNQTLNNINSELNKLSKEILQLEDDLYMTKKMVEEAVMVYRENTSSKNIINSNDQNLSDDIINEYGKNLVELTKNLNESFITIWEIYQEIYE